MTVKFSVCADYHYMPNHYPIGTDGLNDIIKRATDNKVDALIHCGDFIIDTKNGKKARDIFINNPLGVPAFGCYGNHELQMTESLEKLNEFYGYESPYYSKVINGFNFVVTDTNYFEIDGEIKHYPGYSVGGPSWEYDHNLLGKKQLKWLEDTLMNSEYPCIIISHATFMSDAKGSSRDAAKVRDIINKANKKHPKRVLLCINGHHHSNSFKIIDNVVYFNVNVAYMGGWRMEKHQLFPKELCDKYKGASNCVFFKDALNAIVTVTDTGIIDVEGMETTYIYDVSPDMLGIKTTDSIGGMIEPKISDFHTELV